MDQIGKRYRELIDAIKAKKSALAAKRAAFDITLEEVRQLKADIKDLYKQLYTLRLEILKQQKDQEGDPEED